MTTSPQPESPEPLKVVAWRDDGLSASNGTEGPSYRVITDKTRQNLPGTATAAYTDPLVRLSDAEAAIQAARNEAEAMRADAERYRWIKADEGAQFRIIQLSCAGYQYDQEIDAAMKGDAHA